MGVEQGRHETVAEEQSAKENAGKDSHLGIGDESHGWIVVGLDPRLDELGRLCWRSRWRGCWCTSCGSLIGSWCWRSGGKYDGDDGGAKEGEHME